MFQEKNGPSPNGRDGRGKFVPGNPGGPGNPHGRQVAKLRTALVSAVSEEDIRDIAKNLVTSAKAGDLGAVKLVLSYSVGPPHQGPTTDITELSEIQTATKTIGARTELEFADLRRWRS